MNTKTLITGTLLTAFLAATSAHAGDNDHFITADYSATTKSLFFHKVSLQNHSEDTNTSPFISGKK